MKHFASKLFGIFADTHFPSWIQYCINRLFVYLFKIDLSEHEPLHYYDSLNALFTRSLTKAREIASANLISPCDGKILVSGIIDKTTALQIKGFEYNLKDLLTQSLEDTQSLEQFCYYNLYLSPRDYHRFHAPTDLSVTSIAYCDGNLSSVRPSVLCKKAVFAQNERVVLKAFDSFGNLFYFIAIGAFNVGKIAIYVEPRITTNASLGATIYHYQTPLAFKKAQEIGQFKMGSSIILITRMTPNVRDGDIIRFGEAIGN